MSKDTKPKNWPEEIPYLKSPVYFKDIQSAHITRLKTQPPSLPVLSISQTALPCSLVKIKPITLISHPAYQQYGLFANQNLKPGSFIIPYLGRIHTSFTTDHTSNYDLWIDKEADIAVDASKQGNEGRFVNDFRGVGDKANAEFREGWAERWHEVVVGVWVKKGGSGIKKGEEICVSYGKGFWDDRREQV